MKMRVEIPNVDIFIVDIEKNLIRGYKNIYFLPSKSIAINFICNQTCKAFVMIKLYWQTIFSL